MSKTYESPQMTQLAVVPAEVLCTSSLNTNSAVGSSFQRSKGRNDAMEIDASECDDALW